MASSSVGRRGPPNEDDQEPEPERESPHLTRRRFARTEWVGVADERGATAPPKFAVNRDRISKVPRVPQMSGRR
jgi:hypothetical protein